MATETLKRAYVRSVVPRWSLENPDNVGLLCKGGATTYLTIFTGVVEQGYVQVVNPGGLDNRLHTLQNLTGEVFVGPPKTGKRGKGVYDENAYATSLAGVDGFLYQVRPLFAGYIFKRADEYLVVILEARPVCSL